MMRMTFYIRTQNSIIFCFIQTLSARLVYYNQRMKLKRCRYNQLSFCRHPLKCMIIYLKNCHPYLIETGALMLSTQEIEKILETITQHTQATDVCLKEEAINNRFRRVITELRFSTLPTLKTGITENQYLTFKEIEAKQISELYVNTIYEAPTPSQQVSMDTSKTMFLPSENKMLSGFQKNVLEHALLTLKNYGFSEELLTSFILNSPRGFIFKKEHYNTLIYLVTGQQPCFPIAPHLIDTELLLPDQALMQTKDLNVTQLGALDRLFKLKLTGDLLRSFKGPVPFELHHGIALHYLMRKRDPALLAPDAMERIQGLKLKEVKILINTIKLLPKSCKYPKSRFQRT